MNDRARAEVESIVAGEGAYARGSGYEPSLLPQLAQRVDADSVGVLLEAANEFGRAGGLVPAWPQLWESVVVRLAGGSPGQVLGLQEAGMLSPAEVAAFRAVALAAMGGQDGIEVAERAISALGDPEVGANLAARLLAVDPAPVRLQRLLEVDDPGLLDPEAARAVLAAASVIAVGVDPAWRSRAVEGSSGWDTLGRRAHVLSALPPDERTTAADDVAAQLTAGDHPPWFVAMAVSRLAPFTSSPDIWALEALPDPTGVWVPWIEHLLDAPPAAGLDADVRRSHPFGLTLEQVDGAPAAPTGELTRRMIRTWSAGKRQASAVERLESDERRLGVDAYVQGRLLPNALVTGLETVISVSIAREATAQVAPPVPLVFAEGTDMRRLPVKFIDLGNGVDQAVEHEATMTIRRDPASSASVDFMVTPTGTSFAAMIALFEEDGSTIIQAASMAAEVVASLDDAARAERSIQLVWAPVNDWSAVPGGGRAGLVTDGDVLFGGGLPLSVDARAALGEIEAVARGLTTTAGERLVHPDQVSVAPTLAAVARAGYRLRTDLDLDRMGGAERIQVVTLARNVVFPLELVYDGEPPDPDAEVCSDWKGASPCPTCASRPAAEQVRFVCPSRFWGVAKVIEHHHADQPSTHADFVLRALLTDRSPPLAAPTVALVGASSRVVEALTPPGQTGDSTLVVGAIGAHLAGLGTAMVASDWSRWQDIIESDGPTVLIAMPHQERIDEGSVSTPALEIGGVLESTFRESHVRRPGADPGPVVMLLGCRTGTQQDLVSSFASRFRRFAPAVIATIGEVIAAEAPRIAAVLLQELQAAQATSGATVGTAVRDARRALLRDSRLAGLQLVLHGNADWPAN